MATTKLRIAEYNVEWMSNLFDKLGSPITQVSAAADKEERDKQQAAIDKSKMLADIIATMKADFIGIVEGPDTLKNGNKTASKQLDAWIREFLPNSTYRGVHGKFPSNGRQELCGLYKSDKIKVVAVQSSIKESILKKNLTFDDGFFIDTLNKGIKEYYEHYRPPMEIKIENLNGQELCHGIVLHTKSKGIFDRVDMSQYEWLSEKNRMKLYAECANIRQHSEVWLNNGKNLFVMGDVNDGFGLDYYENRFSKSAVELLMGDLWEPQNILAPVIPRPVLRKYGWKPSSSDFKDKLTHDRINVLIDHILVSRNIEVTHAEVWNPYLKKASPEVKALKSELRSAADHFPVVADIKI